MISTAAHAQPAVDIRTYNYAGVLPEQVAAARSTTDQIFRSAGISVRWVDCRITPSGDGAACLEPLREGRDLMLRLMDYGPGTGNDTARSVSLGSSLLDREQRTGVLMTIDLSRVRNIAENAAIHEPTLLGRAIAHEIGHLLLGSAEHPPEGLMRALWSQDELRGFRAAGWQFSSRESARMRQTLAARISGN